MSWGRRVRRVLAAFFGLLAVLCVAGYLHFRISPQAAPPESLRAWAMDTLRAACAQQDWPAPPSFAVSYQATAPIVVELWRQGRLVRSEQGSHELAASVQAVAERLRAGELPCVPEQTQLSLTIPLGDGPLLRGVPVLSALSVVPLKEGLFVKPPGASRAVLTPHAIWARGVVDEGVRTPIPDLTFGMDVEALIDGLRERLPPSQRASAQAGRFAALTWTETLYPRSPHDPAAQVTRENLRTAARDGVRFLLRHQRSNGRFTYVYDGRADRRLSGRRYNLPRHAGTAFFLAQAARVLGDQDAALGAKRALSYVRRNALATCGAPANLCVDEGPISRLGATALTALAGAELLRSVDSPPVRGMVAGLLNHIRAMQRPDGELMHDYDRPKQAPIDRQRLYYSGEAALALLTAHEVLGDTRDLNAVQRLMKHLTGGGWDFFGSRYFYGEEHWTCQAVAAADRHSHDPEALDFCLRWAAFQRAVQYGEGETPWDAAGAYGVGTLFLPRVTAIAARVEAAVPLYGRARAHGLPTAALQHQIDASLGALLRYRWSPGPTHLLQHPLAAYGGVPATLASFKVRNDFVQHAGSAMLARSELLTEPAR